MFMVNGEYRVIEHYRKFISKLIDHKHRRDCNSIKQYRYFHSINAKNKLKISDEYKKFLNEKENDNYSYLAKFKRHPGKFCLKNVRMPIELARQIDEIIGYEITHPDMYEHAYRLKRKLMDRSLPINQKELQEKTRRIFNEVNEKTERIIREESNDVNEEVIEKKVKSIMFNKLKNEVFHWKLMNYNEENIPIYYLISLFYPNYCINYQIMNELLLRKFMRKNSLLNILDYGSGLCSTYWSLQTLLGDNSSSYYLIDISKSMNKLANRIMTMDGQGIISKKQNCFFRQFIPKRKNSFDLVTSTFTLSELSSERQRIESINFLIKSMNPNDGICVVVENGSSAGFKIVQQFRSIALNQFGLKKFIHSLLNWEKNERSSQHHELTIPKHYITTIGPCPHDQECPIADGELKCSFSVRYTPPKIPKWPANIAKHLYCYSAMQIKHIDESLLVECKEELKKFTDIELDDFDRVFSILKKKFFPQKKYQRFVLKCPTTKSNIGNAWICNEEGKLLHITAGQKGSNSIFNTIKRSQIGDCLFSETL
ncbi:hypothetical protein SNEBB_005027 [Seison nebaliae]|nr:hypothetical protein SNEBB_005027 [Seison nebaliae]